MERLNHHLKSTMMDQIEDVLILLASNKTTGYGLTRIPNAIDKEVRGLVRYLGGLEQTDRQVVISIMTRHHGLVLRSFAIRMAALAVRSRNPDIVREGLEALSFASHLVYWKDATLVLSLLYQSLVKLNVDPTSVFAEAVGLGEEQFDVQLRHFPDRKEKDRSIEVMGFKEDSDQDGFRYSYTN